MARGLLSPFVVYVFLIPLFLVFASIYPNLEFIFNRDSNPTSVGGFEKLHSPYFDEDYKNGGFTILLRNQDRQSRYITLKEVKITCGDGTNMIPCNFTLNEENTPAKKNRFFIINTTCDKEKIWADSKGYPTYHFNVNIKYDIIDDDGNTISKNENGKIKHKSNEKPPYFKNILIYTLIGYYTVAATIYLIFKYIGSNPALIISAIYGLTGSTYITIYGGSIYPYQFTPLILPLLPLTTITFYMGMANYLLPPITLIMLLSPTLIVTTANNLPTPTDTDIMMAVIIISYTILTTSPIIINKIMKKTKAKDQR